MILGGNTVPTDVIGKINPPLITKTGGYETLANKGLTAFIGNVITLLITIAGIFTIVNFIMAGYLYLSSNGEPQQLTAAGNKMLQSLIGLAVISGAFIISGLVGYIFFKDATFLYSPKFEKIF